MHPGGRVSSQVMGPEWTTLVVWRVARHVGAIARRVRSNGSNVPVALIPLLVVWRVWHRVEGVQRKVAIRLPGR